MIVRILGESQYDVPDAELEDLQTLDDVWQKDVENGDETSFRSDFDALLVKVRSVGTRVPADYLGPSDLVLPTPDSKLEEVRALLDQGGFIPG